MACNKRSPKDRGVPREGSAARRLQEFNAVKRAVERNKERFIQRLQRRTEHLPNGCVRYKATATEGCPIITLRLEGKHIVMKAHRLFAILRNCAPIPVGMDVAHLESCMNRDCVAHTELQPFQQNAADAMRRRNG